MSTKTEADWDADYQPTVPHFDDSVGISKGAVTPDMIDSTYEPVEVSTVMHFIFPSKLTVTFACLSVQSINATKEIGM